MSATSEETSGIVIDWIGGNCPVQAEGAFGDVPFYFRARGSSVTCDVGRGEDVWTWHGPEYEWPLAGWISKAVARAYIETAHEEYTSARRTDLAALRRSNGLMAAAMNAIQWSAWIEANVGKGDTSEALMAHANDLLAKRKENTP